MTDQWWWEHKDLVTIPIIVDQLKSVAMLNFLHFYPSFWPCWLALFLAFWPNSELEDTYWKNTLVSFHLEWFLSKAQVEEWQKTPTSRWNFMAEVSFSFQMNFQNFLVKMPRQPQLEFVSKSNNSHFSRLERRRWRFLNRFWTRDYSSYCHC